MSIKSKLQFAVTASKDLRWWPFFLQRPFMHPQRRDALAARLARLRRSGTPEGAAHKVPAMERVQQLRSRGFAGLGQLLSAEHCEALRQYFASRDVHDPYRPSLAPFRPLGEGRHENTHIAHHSPADVMNARIVSLIGLSFPAFVSGVLLLILFAIQFRWFPVISTPKSGDLVDRLRALRAGFRFRS